MQQRCVLFHVCNLRSDDHLVCLSITMILHAHYTTGMWDVEWITSNEVIGAKLLENSSCLGCGHFVTDFKRKCFLINHSNSKYKLIAISINYNRKANKHLCRKRNCLYISIESVSAEKAWVIRFYIGLMLFLHSPIQLKNTSLH